MAACGNVGQTARAVSRADVQVIRGTNALDRVSHGTAGSIPRIEVFRQIDAGMIWWLGAESNRRPQHYECRALTV